MGKIKTTHIKQLTGSNYPRWKLEVSTALEAEGLFGHCSGSTPRPNETQEEDLDEWLRNDALVPEVQPFTPKDWQKNGTD